MSLCTDEEASSARHSQEISYDRFYLGVHDNLQSGSEDVVDTDQEEDVPWQEY